ncbi:hypothetical protein GCM10010129_77800 [Streptomyces fumigatiscleroticus]|nr:hypothetical protein GCM10010129_77800 [Streptomyces fumigatiscleroticus]
MTADYSGWKSSVLLEQVRALAVAVAAGQTEHAPNLAAAAAALQYRHDAPLGQDPDMPRPDMPRPDMPRPDMPRPDMPRPDMPRPDMPRPDMPRPDSGLPYLDLERRVSYQGNGFLAVTAGEIRQAMGTRPLAAYHLCTVPEKLPADDDASVCLYDARAGVGALLGAIARGEAPWAAYEAVKNRAVHHHPPSAKH